MGGWLLGSIYLGGCAVNLQVHCKSKWNTKGLTKVQNGLSLYVFLFCVPFFVKKGTQDMILA